MHINRHVQATSGYALASVFDTLRQNVFQANAAIIGLIMQQKYQNKAK